MFKKISSLKHLNLKRGVKAFQQKLITVIIVVIAIAAIVGGAVYFINQRQKSTADNNQTKTADQQNKYVSFLLEVYDKIQQNYWEKITDDQLFQLYKLGTEKIKEQIPEIQVPEVIISNDKNGLKAMTGSVIDKLDEAKKKDYSVNLASIVLANLQPFGRSGLYTTKKQEDLQNRVYNIDPNTNLYDVIGVKKDAPVEEIQKAAQEKTAELENVANDTSQPQEKRDEAEKKLALVTRAKETLAQPEKKDQYDQQGIESTIYTKLIRPDILLLRIKQLSPVSFEELQTAANAADKNAGPELNTLIIDLRGNVGGSIDVMPYFLGFFIGKDQYAYEWYQQGNYTPFKTVVGWLPSLVRFKRVVTLIDEQVQSSAEVMAATFKKYNIGVVLGTKTKGWGTIEKVFPLDKQIDDNETYSLFLVHHITLRDDNQPIEGRGVDPTININDENWQDQLNAYYNYQTLTNAVKEIWAEKP